MAHRMFFSRISLALSIMQPNDRFLKDGLPSDVLLKDDDLQVCMRVCAKGRTNRPHKGTVTAPFPRLSSPKIPSVNTCIMRLFS